MCVGVLLCDGWTTERPTGTGDDDDDVRDDVRRRVYTPPVAWVALGEKVSSRWRRRDRRGVSRRLRV